VLYLQQVLYGILKNRTFYEGNYMNNTQSKTIQALTLRMDTDLHSLIAKAAKRKVRSITGQIIYWLQLGMEVEERFAELPQEVQRLLSAAEPFFTHREE